MKSLLFFGVAIFCNASGWIAVLQANGNVHPVNTTIQAGGTIGLIGALVGAVIALWKDRQTVKQDGEKQLELLRKEVARLNEMIQHERIAHREDIARLQQIHKNDLAEQTEKYAALLKEQLDQLRAENEMKLDERLQRERQRSDSKYKEEST